MRRTKKLLLGTATGLAVLATLGSGTLLTMHAANNVSSVTQTAAPTTATADGTKVTATKASGTKQNYRVTYHDQTGDSQATFKQQTLGNAQTAKDEVDYVGKQTTGAPVKLTKQTAGVIGSLPQFSNDVIQKLNHANQQHHWLTNDNLAEINRRVSTYFSKRGWNLLTGTLSSIGNVVTTVSDWVITLITAPLVLFFMLKDGSRFPHYLSKVVPTAYRGRFVTMLDQMNVKVSSYIRDS